MWRKALTPYIESIEAEMAKAGTPQVIMQFEEEAQRWKRYRTWANRIMIRMEQTANDPDAPAKLIFDINDGADTSNLDALRRFAEKAANTIGAQNLSGELLATVLEDYETQSLVGKEHIRRTPVLEVKPYPSPFFNNEEAPPKPERTPEQIAHDKEIIKRLNAIDKAEWPEHFRLGRISITEIEAWLDERGE